jgi:hypothetical protein
MNVTVKMCTHLITMVSPNQGMEQLYLHSLQDICFCSSPEPSHFYDLEPQVVALATSEVTSTIMLCKFIVTILQLRYSYYLQNKFAA